MKNGVNYSTRRGFLKIVAVAVLLAPVVKACRKKVASLLVKLTGTNYILGHRLWAKNFPKPTTTLNITYLIIGGGITGLSAARQLKKKGIEDFMLIEMGNHSGGNASFGENKYSKFPLGAHYLPLPNFHDKELITFLYESDIITGFDDKGYPVFDEEQLTFTPQERLYYKNSWQDGLVPKYGNSNMLDEEFARFFDLMEKFRVAKGADGKYMFDIPLCFISKDDTYRNFDAITMQRWLQDNSFVSSQLTEYVNYCCRDDFGLGVAYVSAWAGIHYFAARKRNLGNNRVDNVLTWPEGNARLATHLQKYSNDKTYTNYLAFDVRSVDNGVEVLAFNALQNEAVLIKADKVIVTVPQFVNKYIVEGRKEVAKDFTYAPWLLATLTLSSLPDDFSQPLSWDNVIFGAQGLGYIYNQHQSLQQLSDKVVITYYHSFSSADTQKTRKAVYKKDKEYWKTFVLNDLKTAHPAIEELTEEIDIHILGHGMISPVPKFIFGDAKAKAADNNLKNVYFANSDLSGISIFEEAFHQGINAVNLMLNETTLDT